MKRTRQIRNDPEEIAAFDLDTAHEGPEPLIPNHAAVSQYLAAIGRKGGIKGGKSRAQLLTDQQRSDIARNAANARWRSERKE